MLEKKQFPAYWFSLAVLGLTLLATWLRWWRLDSVPPGLWFDEGFNAMEAVWMLKTQNWPIFIGGGQGREVMFHYLLALSIAALGQTIYAVRFVPALLGIFTIPLMYRWVITIFKNDPHKYWIALISTAGLTVSFWYLIMNRVGYRANTLLPVFLLTGYFFWRGRHSGKIWFYVIAGIGLGLCQYTYLAGRLAPLVFVVFCILVSLLYWKNKSKQLKTLWLGLVLMGVIAVLVTSPLLLFFVDSPQLFWERGGDVSLKVDWLSSAGLITFAKHLVSAGRVFVDGRDPNWRHHLQGQSVFDWFSGFGFLIGIVITLKQYRQPHNLFLLSSLFVMWLPAALSDPAFHTLRLVGILPAYYVMVAVGLFSITNWGRLRLPIPLTGWSAGVASLTIVLLLSGSLTYYNYFYRWARLPEVYQAFDGQVVALAQELMSLEEVDLVMPFYLYTHASMRYLMDSQFKEAVFVPETGPAKLSQQQEVMVIIPEYPEDDGKPPAFVWLTKNASNSGMAYVSAVVREKNPLTLDLESATSLQDDQGNIIAYQHRIKRKELVPYFLQSPPQKKADVRWADNLALTGYQFMPAAIEAGNTSNLYLSWDILGYTAVQEKMFIQLLDSQGNAVGQAEFEPISRKMYRWREGRVILEQYPLKFEANLNAGLYFARLGFFDPDTGQRLMAYDRNRELLGDELIVGPLYVSVNNVNPAQPQYSVQAMLDDKIELLGYSLYPSEAQDSTDVELYWKTHIPVEIDYTVFLQVLDQQNGVVAQVDAQPLPNIYPTSHWQPGDIISDRFVLPIPSSDLSGDDKLVTGMYDLSTGARLVVYNNENELLPNGLIQLRD